MSQCLKEKSFDKNNFDKKLYCRAIRVSLHKIFRIILYNLLQERLQLGYPQAFTRCA